MSRVACLAALLFALLLAARGGDDEGETSGREDGAAAETAATTETVADEQPTLQDDVAAIEQVLLAYGAAEGSSACDYLAQNQITDFGGIGICRRQFADLRGVVFRVENVEVEEDSATAVISVKGGSDKSYYELTREEDPGNANLGWKISSYPGDNLGDQPDSAPVSAGGPEPAPARASGPAPEPSQEKINETHVQRLFRDYARVKGSAVCALYSEEFVDRELGGDIQCVRAFEDKKPGVIDLQNLDFTGPKRALVIAKLNGKVLYFELTRTGRKKLGYGGWEIGDLGAPGSG